jgi:hypothetical protein
VPLRAGCADPGRPHRDRRGLGGARPGVQDRPRRPRRLADRDQRASTAGRRRQPTATSRTTTDRLRTWGRTAPRHAVPYGFRARRIKQGKVDLVTHCAVRVGPPGPDRRKQPAPGRGRLGPQPRQGTPLTVSNLRQVCLACPDTLAGHLDPARCCCSRSPSPAAAPRSPACSSTTSPWTSEAWSSPCGLARPAPPCCRPLRHQPGHLPGPRLAGVARGCRPLAPGTGPDQRVSG